MLNFNSTDLDPADAIIRRYTLLSIGIGWIPVPVVDIVVLTAVQLDLVKQLCKVYEVPFKESQGKALVSSLTSSVFTKIIGSGMRRTLKFIPGIGTYLGGLAMSAFSGASTYATGEAVRAHFEAGGTLTEVDPAEFQQSYRKFYKRGRAWIRNWRNHNTAENGQTSTFEKHRRKTKDDLPTLDKLKEISKLYKEGFLTEEEFTKIKAQLLEEL